MYRYQAKHKILSILLVLALLILTSVMIFPSQASANAGVWIWFGPIEVDPVIAPGVCEPVVPPMPVQKLIIDLLDIGQLSSSFTILLGPWPEIIMLEYRSAASWFSPTGHTITDLGMQVEVSFNPPIPDVNQVCVFYDDAFEQEIVVINLIQLVSTLPDFGDAPDPTYPTLLASNGASHQITGLSLGAVVDGEPDGQPTANADGDDNDINGDDEDGVTFTTLLIPGNTADVDVVASAPCLLDAWVDFNIDGDWSDAGEQIFNSLPLVPGVNNLSFGVSVVATTGTTFARFRVSSNGRLSFDGAAPDGEVEDYQVLLSAPEPGSISGMKFDDVNGDGAQNPGEAGIASWSIQLKDENGNLLAETVTDGNGDYAFVSLAPATYQVHEVLAPSWAQIVPGAPGYHAIVLSSGQNVQDVDFGNQYIGEPPVTEVGGEVYPVDRLAILIPGLTLAAILIVGTAVVMRRRRARY